MNNYDQADAFPDATWRKATFCGPNGGNCLEVNRAARGAAGLRDSKADVGPVLRFGDPGWELFLDAAKLDLLDRPDRHKRQILD